MNPILFELVPKLGRALFGGGGLFSAPRLGYRCGPAGGIVPVKKEPVERIAGWFLPHPTVREMQTLVLVLEPPIFSQPRKGKDKSKQLGP